MTKEYFIKWLHAAGLRAIRTAAQAIIVLIGSDMVNIFTIDWLQTLGIAAGMAFVSLLTSIGGLPELKSE
jgi:hypothetical protein